LAACVSQLTTNETGHKATSLTGYSFARRVFDSLLFTLSGIPICAPNEVLGIIADNLSKAGWSWGCVSAIDSEGRTIWIADAHRGDGKRYVVHADEKLSAFLELERVTRESLRFLNAE
jgi:hypothetical protein